MSKTQVQRRRSPKINKLRWAAYATAGTAAAVGMPTSAEADITHVVLGVPVIAPPYSTTVYAVFNVGSAVFAGVHFFHSVAYPEGHAFFGVGSGISDTARIAGFYGGGSRYASNLPYGAFVSAAPFGIPPGFLQKMASHGGFTYSQFLDPGIAYLGMRFDIGAGIQYGWIRVDMLGAPHNGFTIVDYAYADPGERIFAGQLTAIPEPGSLGALALGAVGLVAWRRARRNVAV